MSQPVENNDAVSTIGCISRQALLEAIITLRTLLDSVPAQQDRVPQVRPDGHSPSSDLQYFSYGFLQDVLYDLNVERCSVLTLKLDPDLTADRSDQ